MERIVTLDKAINAIKVAAEEIPVILALFSRISSKKLTRQGSL